MGDPSTRRQAIHDVVAVFFLSVLYVAAELSGVPKRYVFCTLPPVLLVYAAVVWRRGTEGWRDFGLRRDNLASSAVPAGLFTVFAAAVILVWAAVRGESIWRKDLLFLLPLYPVYGIAQQFVFQGVVHRRLRALVPSGAFPLVLTALVFAFVHLGDWRLVGLTFVAGFFWSAIFQRWPNVWVLGFSHGVLAALTYPLLLGDRPLGRI